MKYISEFVKNNKILAFRLMPVLLWDSTVNGTHRTPGNKIGKAQRKKFKRQRMKSRNIQNANDMS